MKSKKKRISNPPAKPYVSAPTDANVILYLQRQSNVMNQDELHPKPIGLPRPKREPLSLAKAIAAGTARPGKPKEVKRPGTRWPNAA